MRNANAIDGLKIYPKELKITKRGQRIQRIVNEYNIDCYNSMPHDKFCTKC